MTCLVEFHVEGIPRPAGGLRIIPARNGGRPQLAPASGKTLKKWQRAIKAALACAYEGEPYLGPVSIDACFYLPRPKAHSTTKGIRPEAPAFPIGKTGNSAGDCDKLMRALGDCLSKVVIADDAQIVNAMLRKRYDDEHDAGAVVSVWTMDALATATYIQAELLA